MNETSVPNQAPDRHLPPRGVDPFYGYAGEGLDLRSLFDILLRGKWLIITAVLAVTIPVVVYSFLSPSFYRSYSILLIDQDDSDLADILPDATPQLWNSERNLSNELLVLEQSMPLAEQVAQRLLAEQTIPGTDRRLSVLEPPDDGSELTVQAVAFRLQEVYVNASLEAGDADAIRVIAVSTDPREAALISNLYANEFSQLTKDQSRSGAAASRVFLEEQVAEQRARLKELDDAVETYMSQEDAVALEAGTARIVDQVASLDAQRDQAEVGLQTKRAELQALQVEFSRLESQLGTRLSSNLDSQLAAIRTRVAELRGQLETYYARNPELRTNPSPSEPEVARLRRELQLAEAEQSEVARRLSSQSLASATSPDDQRSGFVRAAELRAQIAATRVDIRGLEAQVGQVARRVSEYEQDLAQVPVQAMELAQLQRERQGAEALYRALEENLQQASVAEQSELGYADVIRPAFPAGSAFAPRRLRNTFLAIFFGLLIGSVFAIAKVRLDHRIHTPGDLAKLGVPVMGTVPSTTELIAEEYDGADLLEVNGRMVDTHIVSLLNPMATASESYRALRTNIQFSRPDVVVQTILVTSASPSEGKSVTASNLAVVFAQAGRRVLLVDADLRRPTVHRKLGVPREPGLVQALFDEKPFVPEEVAQIADDLYVLPAGSLVPNPSELLGSRRMRDVIESFRASFDIIIFDAPPLLAATDSVLLSTQCDATLVIVRAGQSQDYDIQSALSALSDVGVRPSGLVLNDFDVRRAYGYRYKYAYRYGTRYAYGSPNSTKAPATE